MPARCRVHKVQGWLRLCTAFQVGSARTGFVMGGHRSEEKCSNASMSCLCVLPAGVLFSTCMSLAGRMYDPKGVIACLQAMFAACRHGSQR